MAKIKLENLKIKKGQDQLTVYTHHRSYTNPENYEYNVACIDNLNTFEYKNIPVFDGDKL